MRRRSTAGPLVVLKAAAASLAGLLLFTACVQEQSAPGESLLKDKDGEFIVQTIEGMSQEVRFLLFTSSEDCDYCAVTESFLKDVVSLSPLLSLEVLSLEKDSGRAGEYGVDRAPGIVILGKEDYGIRYYGLPTGYEFVTFAETIRSVGDGTSGLLDETAAALESLTHTVMVTVFSTKS